MKLVKTGVYHSLSRKVGLFSTKETWSDVHPNLQGRVMETLAKFGDVYIQQQVGYPTTDADGDECFIPSNYWNIYVANPQWGASKYSDHSDVEVKFFHNAIMERVFDQISSVEMDMSKVKTVE